MPLRFNGRWRFEPPNDTECTLSQVPPAAVEEFVELVRRLVPQADRWDTLELFKRYLVESTGATYWRSSALHFAERDLLRDAHAAAANAPLFIEAFFDACRAFEGGDANRYAPDAEGSVLSLVEK
jgi:hypothetical protein